MNTSSTNPTIEYREAVEADFPAIIAFYEKFDRHMRALAYNLPGVDNVGQVWLDSFRRTLGRFSQVYVPVVDNEVVGFIRCRVKRVPPYMGEVMTGELMEVWIEPSARRLGLGEKLTRLCIEWMQAQGVHSVEVQILLDNQASLEMCKGLGLKPELYQLRLTWDNYQPE